LKKGEKVRIVSKVYLFGGRHREPDMSPGLVLQARPVPSAGARAEQLVHNAVHSGTRSGYAASRRRPACRSIFVYRAVLPQAVGMSTQLADSPNDYVLRFRADLKIPRADTPSGTAEQFRLYDASAPAIYNRSGGYSEQALDARYYVQNHQNILEQE
jgi:hypothetical protein